MRKKTVLIVGGHRQMGRRLSAMAEELGLDVIGLIQPAHALQVARNRQPDLVLIDMEGSRMGMRGIGAAVLECLLNGRVLVLVPQICCHSVQADEPEGVTAVPRCTSADSLKTTMHGLLGVPSSMGKDISLPSGSSLASVAMKQGAAILVQRRQRPTVALRRTGFSGARVAIGAIRHATYARGAQSGRAPLPRAPVQESRAM
ncbi:MAG: hypothetical protein QM803_17885 [Rhodocyclaceae bacterium]